MAAACAALPAQALADHKPQPFKLAATFSSCRGASLTIATEIRPAAGARRDRAARRALRSVRRASLRLRFQAAPLHGAAQTSKEVNLGRTTRARRFESFGDLPAQAYTGIVRYRWVRGKRTVRSGFIRTRKTRAAGKRGKAVCTLRVGRAPRDTTPPLVFPRPFDGAWKRGPLDVSFFAVDDLSGMAGVFWRLDGGPFQRGRNLRIATEGAHRLDYTARDVAGNWAPLGRATLRVDMGPPTVPTITTPSGATVNRTPAISWNASTDTGSGVRFYWVLVRNAGNAIVFSQPVRASDPRRVTVSPALPLGRYTAEVVALDGATPQPWAATARSAFDVVAADADADGDGVPNASDQCPEEHGGGTESGCPRPTVTSSVTNRTYEQRAQPVTVNFSRAMDPATVNTSSVGLTRSGAAVPRSVTCNSPCTTATVTPTNGDMSGSYTLSVSTAVKSTHGDGPASAYSKSFSVVPYVTTSCTGYTTSGSGTPWSCSEGNLSIAPERGVSATQSVVTTGPIAFSAAAGNALRASFAHSVKLDGSDALRVEVLRGDTSAVIGSPTTVAATSPHSHPFSAVSGLGSYRIRLTLELALGVGSPGTTTVTGLTLGRP